MQAQIETPKARTYYPELDLMKGIAIILVIMGHVIIHATKYGHTLVLNVLAAVHVPAFVFVSGYLASKPIKSWRKFWTGKVLQLLVPMVAVGVLFALCFKRGFTELIYGRYHDGYWFTLTLFMLFGLYAVFRLASEGINTRRNTSIRLLGGEVNIAELAIGALLYGVVYAVDYYGQHEQVIYNATSWMFVKELFPYLLLGHFVSSSSLLGMLYRHKLVGLTAFVLAVALLGLDYNGHPIMYGIPKMFASVCLLYHICLYFGEHSQGTKLGRIVSRIGSNSLGLYLWHWFFLFPYPMTEWVQYMAGGGNTMWELIFVGLGTGGTLLLTYGAVEVLKFNPLTRLILLGLRR